MAHLNYKGCTSAKKIPAHQVGKWNGHMSLQDVNNLVYEN